MRIPGDDVLQSESSCPSLVAETKQRLERFSSATRPPSQTGLNSWEVATNGSRERSHHVAVTHKSHDVQAWPGSTPRYDHAPRPSGLQTERRDFAP
jgi:hypothetical protein